MAWKGIKHYLPRSLYGRAALILILPILTLQLVVSVVFIQRHFDGVTRQMTRSIAVELEHVIDVWNSAATKDVAMQEAVPLAQALALNLRLAPPNVDEARIWYDFSGLSVRQTLRLERPWVGAVDTAENTRRVAVQVETTHGDVVISFDRRRVSASNPHQLLVLMMFLGVLMTLIAFIFLRNQLRPIKRLSLAAEAFGRGEVKRYSPSGANEVRSAGLAFLDMRARIERQAAQRTMMLSGVSHDLRTPLTRLRLGLTLLDEDTTDLERDVDEMERMVAEFLSFARDDASEVPEPTDVAVMIETCVANAHRAGRNVVLHGPLPRETLKMRPLAVQRALENLIGNAVRYGGQADVSAEVTGRSLRITVEDPGPGIPEDSREEALKPFSRLDPGRNQNKGSGVGLGLAIAGDVARTHGGRLELSESKRMGGLRADLVFPKGMSN